jgi:DNA invertase Pin-like site-specific DNA recombinase
MAMQANQAALYLRLSRDDGMDAESNSIGTQRDMLKNYAKEQGINIFGEFIDDGISGTTFDRPGLKQMKAAIEAGCVDTVIVKDLSRFGRNNAMVALHTEMYFPQHNVRFISLNDNIDTAYDDNEIMPFKSVINEYYARDISKKVKSSKRTIAQRGHFIGAFVPYGYIKNPEDRHQLIIDDEAAEVVKWIFNQADAGVTNYAIIHKLLERQVLTPNAYSEERLGIKTGRSYDPDFKFNWSYPTIKRMLMNPVYTGSVVSHRHEIKNFKIRKLTAVPQEDWIVVENMHEPIISKEQFDRVQKHLSVKKRQNTYGVPNLLSGVIKCADCGASLSLHRQTTIRYICSNYRRNGVAAPGKTCTIHSIKYDTINQMVVSYINEFLHNCPSEVEILRRLNAGTGDKHREDRLSKLRKREKELNAIVRKLIEKDALGEITKMTFDDFYSGYKKEQETLSQSIAEIEKRKAAEVDAKNNVREFLETLKRHEQSDELSRQVVLDLIDRIEVHEATGDWRRGTRQQEVDIYWRFIGKL